MITLGQDPSCNENEVFDGLDRNPAEIDWWESQKLALRDCVALLSGHLKAAVDSVYFGRNPLDQSAGILNFSPYAMKGGKITVLAWQPHTREPNPPGSQGHEVIPRKGDTATFYLTGGGRKPFEPIAPNGVVVD